MQSSIEWEGGGNRRRPVHSRTLQRDRSSPYVPARRNVGHSLETAPLVIWRDLVKTTVGRTSTKFSSSCLANSSKYHWRRRHQTHRSSPRLVRLWKKRSNLFLSLMVSLQYAAECNCIVQALVASVDLHRSKAFLHRVHWNIRLQADAVDKLVPGLVDSVQLISGAADTRHNSMVKPMNIRTVQVFKD